ncbi:ADP-L-glycero-D-manno-heptose-6-epimerase [Luteitalea sp. TBR-22]|uniref:ADP-glyceromanno-heptose 6-epimerase n=1 Tax=Luteitalea sp. TBR-22 TaxID=2802971 RepID=UPI001AFAB2A4|nr:ADP-glyceromanno-heptose 6-epimerase [Luteitalea sp. TBR-22]BCS32706.1 ADP-L-glycero-D-manno-heptose-6-epimerase [Luteitalea sp. TBR-22]
MIDLGRARVLVTGGAGFIGSALVWGLNARGTSRIVIADHLGTGPKWRNLRALRFEDYLEAGDLLPRLESGALGAFDLVLHMGACSATTEQDAAYLARNNYEFSKDLCRWALGRGSAFVYASSAATYGDGAAGMDDDPASIEALRPLNMYGYSKLLFDRWARDEGLLGRVAGLRFFNVFGPNEDHKGEMRSVVHKAYAQILADGEIRLFRSHRPDYRDGEQQRDFVYVKDVVDMTLHVAAHGASGLFNMGTGQARTWLDLVRPMFTALGRPERITFVDMPETLRATYQYHTLADVSRLRAAGYDAAPTPLAQAVTEYVRDYLVPGRHLGDE